MVNALFGGTPESYVPEHHAPPASAHCLPLAILSRRKLPSLALPILYEGLQAHRWPKLLQVTNVAESLCKAGKLHHIAEQVRICGGNDLRD